MYEKFDSSNQDTDILYRLTHKDIVMTYFRGFKSVQTINWQFLNKNSKTWFDLIWTYLIVKITYYTKRLETVFTTYKFLSKKCKVNDDIKRLKICPV